MSDLLTMKCLPECDRPYEKAERNGIASLTDSELLAVIIKTGTKNLNALDVAQRLIVECGERGLCGISDMSLQDFMQVEGIGRVKAIQLRAVCEIARRFSRNRSIYREAFRDFASLGEFFVTEMSDLKQEVFKTVLLDTQHRVIKIVDVSVGTIDMALVHPREVFLEAIRCASKSIVLVHNHPSGDILPSDADKKTTARLIISGEIIGIKVVEHLIIGNTSYYSMLLMGDIEKIKRDIHNSSVIQL